MEKKLKYAFRITHIDNIPHIIRYGLVKKNSPYRNNNFVSIGDQQVIQKREKSDATEGRISDYIPFYFGPRSPMLYVIQNGYNDVKQLNPEKIVYCVIRLNDIINSNIDCIFTNGHALSKLTKSFAKDMLPRIDEIIRYDDVYSTRWNLETDVDLKRRKEAELLIKDDLPISFICGYVVYNEDAKLALMNFGINGNQIEVRPTYYF